VGIATKITRRRYLDRESKLCEGFANVEIAPKTATGREIWILSAGV
jgi:hypothetical protein